MKRSARYVAKAIVGTGWRVWDRNRNRWWGRVFPDHPAPLLDELNADRASPRVVELSRASRAVPDRCEGSKSRG